MATLRDHVERTKLQVHGAPDLAAPLRERMLEVSFDEKALGNFELEEQKEPAKRLNEMHALAYALVGCDVDRELVDVHPMPTRKEIPTPDFEAVTCDGPVRIELCRLVDAEKRYLNALDQIATRVYRLLIADAAMACLTGTITLRFYGDMPRASHIEMAVAELARALPSVAPYTPPSTTLWPFGVEYVTLHRLGAHWARTSASGSLQLQIEPNKGLSFRDDALRQFDKMFQKKAGKIEHYSDGMPVWLVMYDDTRVSYPLGTIQALSERQDFDPRPFARVLVGCFTAGVIFEPALPPRITSPMSTV